MCGSMETLYELEDRPILDPKKTHDIDVVVDRFKNRPDIELRISESIETALHLSEGLIRIVPIEDPENQETLCSIHHACIQCGYSTPKLEPRNFSFNSPKGACKTCNGLGVQRVMDPDKVIHAPDVGIAQGAIRGFDTKHMAFFETMTSLAKTL